MTGRSGFSRFFGFFENRVTDGGGAISGEHSATGVIPAFVEEQRQYGMGVDMSMFVPTVND
jgi:predicted outer membrane repeat protein